MREPALPGRPAHPPPAEALLTHMLALLDGLRPNLKRTLCVDLMVTCPAVSAGTTFRLAPLALQDADGLRSHPQRLVLATHIRRPGALPASLARHGLVA